MRRNSWITARKQPALSIYTHPFCLSVCHNVFIAGFSACYNLGTRDAHVVSTAKQSWRKSFVHENGGSLFLHPPLPAAQSLILDSRPYFFSSSAVLLFFLFKVPRCKVAVTLNPYTIHSLCQFSEFLFTSNVSTIHSKFNE